MKISFMNIKINSNEPKINIIKDHVAEEAFIQELALKVVNELEQNHEVSEKVKIIGKEELLNIAIQSMRETLKKSEEKQIEDAKKMSEELTNAMLSSVVKTTLEFAKNL